jgi:hypothetical protein
VSEDHISISFKCKQCETKLSWPDDAADSLEIACAGCGAPAGTFGELREAALNALKEKSRAMLKGTFKKLR